MITLRSPPRISPDWRPKLPDRLADGDILDEIHPAVDHHPALANAAQPQRYGAPYDFDDLNTGAIQWQVPLGEIKRPGSRRTRDRDTRKVIWETGMAEASEGVLSVYEVAGREYIVFSIAAGSGIMRGQKAQKAGAYVAYAHPTR